MQLVASTSDKSASSAWTCNSSKRSLAASFSVSIMCIVVVVEVVVVGEDGEQLIEEAIVSLLRSKWRPLLAGLT